MNTYLPVGWIGGYGGGGCNVKRHEKKIVTKNQLINDAWNPMRKKILIENYIHWHTLIHVPSGLRMCRRSDENSAKYDSAGITRKNL